MSYLEDRMRECTLYGKTSINEINRFFVDYNLFNQGMERALKRVKFLNSHDSDKTSITDQVEKISTNVSELYVPQPTNLLTALVYLRRLSYLFMKENELDKLAKDSEIIPILIEGLYMDYINNSSTRIYIGAYYYDQERGYITELKKLAGQTNAKQYNDFSTAYSLQNDLVEYYKNNTKDFYKNLAKAKKGKIEYFDIVTIAKEENEKQLKKKIKRR